jgi:hypothetical protein
VESRQGEGDDLALRAFNAVRESMAYAEFQKLKVPFMRSKDATKLAEKLAQFVFDRRHYSERTCADTLPALKTALSKKLADMVKHLLAPRVSLRLLRRVVPVTIQRHACVHCVGFMNRNVLGPSPTPCFR